jgi:phage baseplate assembly protein W
MRPAFGAGVNEYVFQSNGDAVRDALASAIKDALTRWEPRIDLDAVRVEAVPFQDSQVLVSIDYRLRATNELFNVVYPLYVQEGAL